MSARGLGCFKTVFLSSSKHRLCFVRPIYQVFRIFRSVMARERSRWLYRVSVDRISVRTHARIAAMSGLIPTMFIARVKL